MGSPRRVGPFARVYHGYIKAWDAKGLGRMEQTALLLLCEGIDIHERNSEEIPVVSYGRRRMAEELGWNPKQVDNTISRLKAKGCLKEREPGRRGHQASYYLMPGVPWPLKEGNANRPRPDKPEPGRGPQEMDRRWH